MTIKKKSPDYISCTNITFIFIIFHSFYFLRDNFKGHPKTAQFAFCDPYY